MLRSWKRSTIPSPLLASLLCMLLAACGGGESPPSTPTPQPPPAPTNIAPSITTQPMAQSVSEPGSANFQVVAAGTPAPVYQWQSSTDGMTFTDISGANNAAYNTGATTLAQSGRSFRVVITNSAGNVTSNAATLTVSAAPALPAILTQPSAQSVTAPAPATFSVTASSNPSPTYQWQFSLDGTSYSDIAGATGSSFTTLATLAAQSGRRYRVVISNNVGSITSDGAVLSVNAAVEGATIIYSRNNGNMNVANVDLYAIRESGGQSVELATSAANDNFCGVTPSGRVIYQRQGPAGSDIYSVRSDGSDTRTLANSTADETCVKIVASGPAAGRLIYRRDSATSARDLYAVNEDGTNATPLANGPLNDDFAALTDGFRVIFQTDPFQDRNVYSVDLEGLSVMPLAASGNYEGYAGSVGNTIVFGAVNFFQGDLYTVDVLGGSLMPLATDPGASEDLAGITPAGTLLIHKQAQGSNNRDIYTGGGVALAATGDFEQHLGSSAGGRVVYSRNGQQGNLLGIHSVRIDGSGDVALAPELESASLAHIFGEQAIVASYDTSDPATLGDLHLVNLDGSGQISLATSIHHETFAAIGGNKLLYRRETANAFNDIQLWCVNLDGSGAMRLFSLGGPGFFMGFTPAGRVLVNNYTGTDNLYIVNPDGSEQRLLVNGGSYHAVIP